MDSQSAEIAAGQPVREDLDGPYKSYERDLKAPIFTEVNANPRATVHSAEWRRVLAGDPVEVNPSDGFGLKVMTIGEWTANWKRNDDFPDCLACGSLRTREHHFEQEWCRGAKKWSAEALCLDCHGWSWRSYADPHYLAPEDHEKLMWEKMVVQNDGFKADMRKALPA